MIHQGGTTPVVSFLQKLNRKPVKVLATAGPDDAPPGPNKGFAGTLTLLLEFMTLIALGYGKKLQA